MPLIIKEDKESYSFHELPTNNEADNVDRSTIDSVISISPSREPNTPTDTEGLHHSPFQTTTNLALASSFGQNYSPKSQTGLASFTDRSLLQSISNIRAQKLNDDILQSLHSEENIILQKISDLSKIHEGILNRETSTKKVRDAFLRCFKSLNQLYEAISEIYEKEANRLQIFVTQFEERNKTRKELVYEIEEIRDKKQGEGFRLSQLLSEKESVDNEVDALEKRLNQLKEKREVLKREIQESESIIESRASSYLEALRDVEEEDRNDINLLIEEKSIIGTYSNDQKGNSISDLFSKLKAQRTKINQEIVINALSLQVESLIDNTTKFKKKAESLFESCIILENTSDLLDGLEAELIRIMKNADGNHKTTEKKIIQALKTTYDLLSERLLQFRNIDDLVKQILTAEINSIKKGLSVFGITKEIKVQGSNSTDEVLTAKEVQKHNKSQNIRITEPSISTSPPVSSAISGSGSFNTPISLQDMLKNNLKFKQGNQKHNKND